MMLTVAWGRGGKGGGGGGGISASRTDDVLGIWSSSGGGTGASAGFGVAGLALSLIQIWKYLACSMRALQYVAVPPAVPFGPRERLRSTCCGPWVDLQPLKLN